MKPTLHLVHSKYALDLDTLMGLYEKLTGRKPTPEEIAVCKEKLDKAKRDQAKKNQK